MKYPSIIIFFLLELSLFTNCNVVKNKDVTAGMVPISVPFEGNSYVTYPLGSDLIDHSTGKINGFWDDDHTVMSTFFKVGNAGTLNIGFSGSNITGSSVISFTINDVNYEIKVAGKEEKLYPITQIQRERPGYQKVDIRGLKRSGASFGEISSFRIGGEATQGTNHFVTKEEMMKDEASTYFFRRGASTHLIYLIPEEKVDYFYNEALVPESSAINGSYYMINGFSAGYMGMQQLTNGERVVLFSVWSPYNTDNPNEIPEEMRVQVLDYGRNVRIGDFGNEGSGIQCFLDYEWKPGVTYKTLIGVKPDGNGNTIYTAYFHDEKKWQLIASLKLPVTDSYLTGAHSFLENFDPQQSIFTREVTFKNQWARLTTGEWVEVTRAQFSMDNTGRKGLRHDAQGYYDESTNGFVLRGFGFFDQSTEYGKTLERLPSDTGITEINIDELPQDQSF